MVSQINQLRYAGPAYRISELGLRDFAHEKIAKHGDPFGISHFFRIDEIRFVGRAVEVGEELDDLRALLSHVIREARDPDSPYDCTQDIRKLVHLENRRALLARR